MKVLMFLRVQSSQITHRSKPAPSFISRLMQIDAAGYTAKLAELDEDLLPRNYEPAVQPVVGNNSPNQSVHYYCVYAAPSSHADHIFSSLFTQSSIDNHVQSYQFRAMDSDGGSFYSPDNARTGAVADIQMTSVDNGMSVVDAIFRA